MSWCLAPSLARYEDPLVKIYLDGHKNICGMMSLQMQISTTTLLTRIHGHDDTHDTRSAFCLLKWSGIRILQLLELLVNLRQTFYYFRHKLLMFLQFNRHFFIASNFANVKDLLFDCYSSFLGFISLKNHIMPISFLRGFIKKIAAQNSNFEKF